MKHSNTLILGIDPGLEKTGYGLIKIDGNIEKVVEGGVVRSGANKPIESRLVSIYKGINEIIREFNPSTVAIEELYIHKSYPKTAVLMGYVRGVILLSAGLSSISVVNYSATAVKKFLTGNGRATKEQVQRMIMSRLNLNKVPTPNDVSDALAIALCHASVMLREI